MEELTKKEVVISKLICNNCGNEIENIWWQPDEEDMICDCGSEMVLEDIEE
jgi:hypothetical protein